MATATYIANNQFYVADDQTEYLREGQKILLDQGVDGTPDVTVQSFTYNAGEDRTEVTIEEDTITANLVTASNSDNIPANTPKHLHPEMPAAGLSGDEVDFLQAIQVPTGGDDNKILRVTDEETGLELVVLQGVTNRTTISHAAGTITITIPQDIHTDATPEFAGAKFSGLTGILEGKGSSANIGAIAATGSLQILRRNATNDAYELANVNLQELYDLLISSPAEGDIIVRNGSSKWVNKAVGTEGYFLAISSGVPEWVVSPSIAASEDAQTIDFMFFGA